MKLMFFAVPVHRLELSMGTRREKFSQAMKCANLKLMCVSETVIETKEFPNWTLFLIDMTFCQEGLISEQYRYVTGYSFLCRN
jgi:hypothetical protein